MKGMLTGLIVTSLLVVLLVLAFAPLNQSPAPSIIDYNNQVNTQSNLTLFPIPIDQTSKWAANIGHRQSSKFITDFTETLGGGLCINDVNNDGWLDLLVVGGGGFSRHYGKKAWWHQLNGNQLLLNQQGEYFLLADESWGIGARDSGISCAFADLDNDGDDDLIMTGLVGVHLFKKEDSTFTLQPLPNLGGKATMATSAALADFDQDGYVDIYVSQLVKYSKGARTYEPNRGFTGTQGAPFMPSLHDSQSNLLLHNTGDFTFVERAVELGVDNNFGRSIAAKWLDLNNDAWLDLVVLNSFETPSQVFINQQGKEFVRATDAFSALQLPHTKSLARIQDTKNNRFFLARALGHTNTVLQQPADSTDLSPKFTDISRLVNGYQSQSQTKNAWGSVAADFNNDGLKDLVVTNGMLKPDSDSKFLSQAQRNAMYWSTTPEQFHSSWLDLASHLPYSSRDAVDADFDNDGWLELVVANNNDDINIIGFEPTTHQNWISFDILKSYQRQEWFFSKVTLSAGNLKQIDVYDYAQSNFAQGDTRLHFGIAQHTAVDTLEITKANGETLIFKSLEANNHYVLDVESGTLKKTNSNDIHDDPNAIGLHALSALRKQTDLSTQGLFALLMASENPSLYDLRATWHAGSDSQKLKYISLIEDKFNLHYLWFLEDALASSNKALRMRAISALKHLELEQSVRLLSPLLQESDEELQCAVANTFAFFFEEEEAVLFRKQLAVVPLLAALKDASSPAQTCIIKALAASENKRSALAILPLIENSDSKRNLTAIRALGLIRDGRALPSLVALLNKTQHASTIATLLIALEKLAYDDVASYIQQQLGSIDANQLLQMPTSSALNYSTILNVLAAILSSEDDVVLAKYNINKLAEAHIRVALKSKDALISATQNQALSHLMLDTRFQLQKDSGDFTRASTSLTPLQVALILNDEKAQHYGLIATLADSKSESLRHILLALSIFEQKSIALNNLQLNRLVQLTQQISGDVSDHFSVVLALPRRSQASFINTLLVSVDPKNQKAVILFAKQHHIPTRIKTIKTMLASTPHTTEILTWYYSTLALNSPKDLSLRIALNKVLKNGEGLPEVDTLLLTAASKDAIIFGSYYQRLDKIFTPQAQLAIANSYREKSLPLPKSVRMAIERLIDTASLTLEQRTFAASLLPDSDQTARLLTDAWFFNQQPHQSSTISQR